MIERRSIELKTNLANNLINKDMIRNCETKQINKYIMNFFYHNVSLTSINYML